MPGNNTGGTGHSVSSITGGIVGDIVSASDYIGVAGCWRLSQARIPLPSEVMIMPFAGYPRVHGVVQPRAGRDGWRYARQRPFTLAYAVVARGCRALAERDGAIPSCAIQGALGRSDSFFQRVDSLAIPG